MEIKTTQQSPEMLAHQLIIPIDVGSTNLPVLHGLSCTDYERENSGPRLRSALDEHQLAFKDCWEKAHKALAPEHLIFALPMTCLSTHN